MKPEIVHVFVSSTWLDLKPERKRVESALQQLKTTKYVGMEHFGSRGESTHDMSLAEVDRSQIYVGIIGGRYGSGVTEEEYRRARARGLTCLIYFKDEAGIPARWRKRDSRLIRLKRTLRSTHSITIVRNPDDLAARITADLHNWLFEQYLPDVLARASLSGERSAVERIAGAARDKKSLRAGLAKHGVIAGVDVADSLLAAGERKVITSYTRGISGPLDYAGRIRNFLSEYLGDSEHPVPFGGRDADLELLDRWLENPKAPPYLLFAAPAGRGKSALLVRWSRRLLARGKDAIVFFPVSARFRTNQSSVFLAAVASRLAALHGEQLPASSDVAPEVWRDVIANLLARPVQDGRRVVVIIDGLDEAADWELGPDLLPPYPAKELRVIVSARLLAGQPDATGWLRTLRWERPGLAQCQALAPLTQEAVADVLRHMGPPLSLEARSARSVSELHRLSEGDPLLVRLYVDELTAPAANAEQKPRRIADLTARPAGLAGYFENWRDEQRRVQGKLSPLHEPLVDALLNLLSCALGPLSRDDLPRLMDGAAPLTTNALDDVLKPLARFVRGDGQAQGFVFSHPRLAAFFFEKLADSDRELWERRFLTFGAETLQRLTSGDLPPDRASPYIVQHYGAHLVRAGATVERLAPLVSDGWRRAWEHVEKSYGGFLNDVDRVWRAAEATNRASLEAGGWASVLAMEARCALARGSVSSLAANIPPALFASLVKHGIRTDAQAFAYARQLPETDRKASAVAVLVPCLGEHLLPDALSVARTIEDDSHRAVVVKAIARRLDKAPWLAAETLELVRNIRDEAVRSELLRDLAPTIPVDLIAEALDVARTLSDTTADRASALAALAPFAPEPLRAVAAHEAVGSWCATGSDEHAELTAAAAALLPSAVFKDLLMAIGNIKSDKSQASALVALAPYLPSAFFGRALQLALSIDRDWGQPVYQGNRARALSALAVHAPKHVLPVLLGHARRIRFLGHRAQILAPIASRLTDPDRQDVLGEAADAAFQVQSDRDRAEAVGAAAAHLDGDVLEEALADAGGMGDGWARARVITALSPHLPEPLLGDALRIAGSRVGATFGAALLRGMAARLDASTQQKALEYALRWDSSQRADVLETIVPHLDDAPLAVAVRATRELQSPRDRAWVLTAAAGRFADPLRSAVIGEALDAARLVPYGGFRLAVILRVSEYLCGATLDAAVACARSLPYSRHRSAGLASLAPRVPERDRRTIWKEAITAARAISNPAIRARILARFSPQLAPPLQQQVARDAMRFVASRSADPRVKAELLVALAACVPDLACRNALALVEKSGSAEDRASLLAALTPHFPKALLPKALDAARSLWTPEAKAETLARLATRFEGDVRDALEQEVLETAIMAPDDWEQLAALLLAAHHLSQKTREDAQREALTRMLRLPAGRKKASTLADAAALLPEPLQGDTARQALELLRLVPDATSDGGASLARDLVSLVPSLPEDALPDAQSLATRISSEYPRAQALAAVARRVPAVWPEVLRTVARYSADALARATLVLQFAPELPAEHLEPALRFMGVETTGVDAAVIALSPRLSDGLVEQALALAKTCCRGEPRVFAALLPRIPASLLPTAIESVRPGLMQPATDRSWETVASYLSKKELEEVLARSPNLDDGDARLQTESALLEYLPEPLRGGAARESFQRARSAGSQLPWAGVAAHLPGALFEDVLDGVEQIAGSFSDSDRARALTDLSPYLPEPVLARAIGIASRIESDSSKAEALLALVPRSSGAARDAAVATLAAFAAQTGDPGTRAALLTGLAPYAAPASRERTVRAALEAAAAIDSRHARAEALLALLPQMSSALVAEALTIIDAFSEGTRPGESFANRAIDASRAQVHALAGIAPYLSEPLIAKALDIVLGMETSYRAGALATLVGRLSPAELERAFADTTTIRASNGGVALASVASRFAEPRRSAELRKIVDQTLSERGLLGSWRLAGLAPYLPESLLREMLAAARDMTNRDGQARVISAVVRHLPPAREHVADALSPALETTDHVERGEYLTTLRPSLALLPRKDLHTVWCQALHRLSARTRRDLLSDFRALAPTIAALGGESAVEQTGAAIRDVGEWWP